MSERQRSSHPSPEQRSTHPDATEASWDIGGVVDSLGRSIARRGRVERIYAPAVLRELGPQRAAETFADELVVDADRLAAAGRAEIAALVREAASTFRVAARRLKRTTRKAIGLWLGEGVNIARVEAADPVDVLDGVRRARPLTWANAVLLANMKGAHDDG